MSRNTRSATVSILSIVLFPVLVLLAGKPTVAGAINAVYDCSSRYVVLYENFGGGGGARHYCISSDRDIESEPGNVMGPLGDGNPVDYRNDFDTSATSSGVSSVYIWDAAGGSLWGVCLYAGKDFTGAYIQEWGTFGPFDLVSPYVLNDLAGSMKLITSPGSC
jgi:hypothetical protein